MEDEAIEGNRNNRYRSVNALAFGDGPRKSYLVSIKLEQTFQRQAAPVVGTSEERPSWNVSDLPVDVIST